MNSLRMTNATIGCRVLAAGLLLGSALLLQGCLAGAWVAAVASDYWGEAGSIIFAPFEHAWVASDETERAALASTPVQSIAVPPFAGDADMGGRLVTVLQQETSLRVASVTGAAPGADPSQQDTLAQTLAQRDGVDAVLFGRVEAVPQHPSDWGWAGQEPRRLYLQLVDRHGALLWSDELPYTVVKGSAPPLEARVQSDLAGQVVKEIESLHLDELGYLPKKSSS